MILKNLFSTFYFTLTLVVLTSCVSQNPDSDIFGTSGNKDMSLSGINSIKIVANGAGYQSEIADFGLVLGQSLTLKAILVDAFSGAYVKDIEVNWGFSNDTFNGSDFVAPYLNASVITIQPTKVGSVQVIATYNGDDPTVIGRADTTGNLTVVEASAVLKVIKIVGSGSGFQSEIGDFGIVMGSPRSLKAAVFDGLTGQYISDIAVDWSFVGGPFTVSDFSSSFSNQTEITISPTTSGITQVRATYTGPDTSIVITSDLSGIMSVTSVPVVQKVIKIVSSGSGFQSEVLDFGVNKGESRTLKAAIFDNLTGIYLGDVAVDWSFSGGGFSSSDFSTSPSNSTQITLTPQTSGTTQVIATYNGPDETIVGTTDTTGYLTVFETPMVLKVIRIVDSGDGFQSEIGDFGIVYGGSRSLKAAVFDSLTGMYLQDIEVDWSFNGGGFSSQDFSTNPLNSIGITVSPFNAGITQVVANYNGSDQSIVGSSDTTGNLTVTTTPNVQKVVRIVSSGSGFQSEIGDFGILSGQSRTVKAALFDALTGTYISDIAVDWSFSGGDFDTTDFGTNPVNSTEITISPLRTGVTQLVATYNGTDTTIYTRTDTTGNLTVSRTPNTQKVIRIVGQGDGFQSEIFDFTIIPGQSRTLKAAVFDSLTGAYISDISVDWSFNGGGFDTDDFSTDFTDVSEITISPLVTGTTQVVATYTGSDATIIGRGDTTGNLVVSSNANVQKVVRIVGSGVGFQSEIGDFGIIAGASRSLKAALFDSLTGMYISDIEVDWSFAGGGFDSTDFATTPTNSTDITITPVHTGVTQVIATYSGSDVTIVGTADTTGNLTVAIAPPSLKVIKIVTSGAGFQSDVGDINLELGQSRTMKAALFDAFTGFYISDVAVDWSFSGGGFISDDFSSSTTNAVQVTLTPQRTGVTQVIANYRGSDSDVIGAADTTGNISVTTMITPALVQYVSGNNQTAVVNNTLPIPLKVRVLSDTGVAVSGRAVLFSVVQSGGVIVTPQPSITNADGYAEAIVRMSSLVEVNYFRATVPGVSINAVDFTAQSTVGAPNRLAFIREPALTYATTPFLVQPIVQIQDSYGNAVTNFDRPVTISVETGSGSLSGTLTVTSSQGNAQFTGLSYDEVETNVVLKAMASGLSDAFTSPFSITNMIGACQSSGAGWVTAGGGCQQISTGLIWSAPTTISYSWYEAVWDMYRGGGGGSDDGDFGRTNDYPSGLGCSGSCDNSPVNVCKDLSLNGFEDWRMPTLQDMQAAFANGAGTTLYNAESTFYWSADTYDRNPTQGTVYNLSAGTSTNAGKSSFYKIYCVRGARTNLSRVTNVETFQNVKVGTFGHGVKLQLMDASGVGRVNAERVPIELSINQGEMTGVVSGETNQVGELILSRWSVDTLGNLVLTAQSPNLIRSDVTITGVNNYNRNCQANSSRFQTADGGCKDLSTGLVWSSISGATMFWYDAVWGGASNAALDANDDVTQDYGPVGCTGYCDGSAYGNYCKTLNENGAQDWRLPHMGELVQIAANSDLTTNITAITNAASVHLWSGTSWLLDTRFARMMRGDSLNTAGWKATTYNAICVRESPVEDVIKHNCLLNNANFNTQEGGCKDLASGLIWSLPSSSKMVWFEAVWDGSNPDKYDFVSNHYEGTSCAGYCDDPSWPSYCHDLVEGGKRDWRLPTRAELGSLAGKASTYLRGDMSDWYFTGGTVGSDSRYNWGITPQSGASTGLWKWSEYRVMCVR